MSFFKKDKKSKSKKTLRETSSDALEQGRVEKYSARKRTNFVLKLSFKLINIKTLFHFSVQQLSKMVAK